MNFQGWAGDKRRNVLLGDCFESRGHRFTGDPGLKGVQISFPSGCLSAERYSSPAPDQGASVDHRFRFVAFLIISTRERVRRRVQRLVRLGFILSATAFGRPAFRSKRTYQAH